MAAKKTKTLEESFQELNEIISQLESEDTSLEESFLLYEKGMKLSVQCQKSIDLVEKKVTVLKAGQE